MAIEKTFGEGVLTTTGTTTVPSGAGAGATIDVPKGIKNHMMQVTHLGFLGTVVFVVEGTQDGTSWFTMDLDTNFSITGFSISSNQVSVTSNIDALLRINPQEISGIRCRKVSGPATVGTVEYLGGT